MIATKTYGGFFISQIRHLSGRIWEKLLKDSGVDVFDGAQGRILYIYSGRYFKIGDFLGEIGDFYKKGE